MLQNLRLLNLDVVLELYANLLPYLDPRAYDDFVTVKGVSMEVPCSN